MNLINLNPISMKSKRNRKGSNPVLKEEKPKSLLKNASTCKHNRNIDINYGEVYCSKCFAVYDFWYVNDEAEKIKGNNIVLWDRQYDKSRWTGYSIDLMMGKNSWELPDQCWLELMRDIPDPFKWYDVYKVFQKYRLLKYWVAFGHFINLGIKLNPKIMAYFNKYMEIKQGKYAISYYYLLYKFTQLFGEEGDEQYVPLKNSITWCKKTDLWWQEVCEEEKFEFKPTKVHQIKWNKEEVLRKFALCVKQMKQNKNV